MQLLAHIINLVTNIIQAINWICVLATQNTLLTNSGISNQSVSQSVNQFQSAYIHSVNQKHVLNDDIVYKSFMIYVCRYGNVYICLCKYMPCICM